MKRGLILFLALALTRGVGAQTFEWAAVTPIELSTNPDHLEHTLALDTSGAPIYSRLVRSHLVYDTYFGDQAIQKMNGAGVPQFLDTLFGKVSVQDIAVDGNDNIYVGGRFLDTIIVDTARRIIPPASLPNCFLLKIRSDGTFLWLRNMTASNPDWAGFSCLVADGTSGLWGAVQTNSLNSLAVKFDGSGHELLSLVQTNVRVLSGLALDSNHNIWVTGSTFNDPLSFGGFDTTAPFPYNMYVARYSAAGTVTWVRFIEDATLQLPRIMTRGSSAVMAGNLMVPATFGDLAAHGPQWVYDFFVTKIDSSGRFRWLREIPSGNDQGDATIGAGPFLAVSAGDILLSGYTRSTITWGPGVVTHARGYQDVLVIAYSDAGEMQWVKTAGSSVWSNRADAVVMDRQGRAYVAGMVGRNAMFDSLQTGGGDANFFIARIGAGTVASVHEGAPARTFALQQNYPNPFNPATTIQFTIPDGVLSPTDLRVFDILGREVATVLNEVEMPGDHEVTFDASHLASGVYFCRLRAGDFSATRRIVLLR